MSSHLTQDLENKVEELTEEICDLKMANEKLEDGLKEKKRAAEGMELVSRKCAAIRQHNEKHM